MRKIRFTALLAAFMTVTALAAQQQPLDTVSVAKADSTASETIVPDFPEESRMIDYKNPKKYVIRDIKVQGVQYLDPNILIATSGLVRGDSIYIPGSNIKMAESRLWSQRYFSDVKIGATIDGDKVDLTLILQERPRVFRWLFEGIGRGQQNELIDKLSLKRNSELSDYILEKNKTHHQEL